MAGIQDLHRGPTLPLLFMLFGCVLYIMFDMTAYHPQVTPLGIYKMYACDVNNVSTTVAPVVITVAPTTTTTTTTEKPKPLDVTDKDLKFVPDGNYTAKIGE